MPTDLSVMLENRPGMLASLGETLGRAGVNIDGISGIPTQGRAELHVLVEDPAAARQALKAAGMEVQAERPVLVFNMEDRPGELGKLCRRIANAGVNIELIYMATNSRVVIGADNLEKARSAR